MPSLAVSTPAPRAAALLRRRGGVLPLAVLFGLAALPAARAQVAPTHLDDAAPVPAGMLRLRVSNVWTRFDERFAANGARSRLNDPLSTDSLGTAQLPLLAPIEAAARTLALDPALRLSLGSLRVRGNARIVTTPIAIEYGVTRRFSVGLLIPIVQTRRVAIAVVTGDSTRANFGYVDPASRASAASANDLVAKAYQRAADSLATLITRCPTNPSASGCAVVNANGAGAAAARARAQSYADGARALGTTTTNALVAPRASSELADRLDARRRELNQQLQQYLGAGAGSATGVFTAKTDFSYIDLQGRAGQPALLGGSFGGGLDSIHTTERIGFGDIAVGAQFQLFDRFQHDAAPPPRVQTRMSVGAAVRFATSRADSAESLLDIPTGDGAGFELRSAWDVIVGRVGGTVAGRYVASFARTVRAPLYGDPEAPFPYPTFGERSRAAGTVIGLDITPRLLLTSLLALDGHYGIERVGPASYSANSSSALLDPCMGCTSPGIFTESGTARTAQRVGLGVRFSTVDAFARGQASYPIEVSFAHLATVAGDPGVAALSRDQIQLRLFYQVLRRR